MAEPEPKFWAEEVYPSDRGLHFKFADAIEAQRFYLHLQYKGATANIDGTEVIICRREPNSKS